jgi:hypothetical protein
VDIPESMAKMAATAMIEQLSGEGTLTPEHLEKFFNHYLGKEN